MMIRWSLMLLLLSLAVITACKRSPEAQGSRPTAASTNQQIFQVKGVVIAVKPKEKSIEIKHEAIPGYMPAMTMPFDVKDAKELTGLQPGDSVSFRMLVTDTEGWIDQIRKISSSGTNAAAASSPIQL